MDFINDFMDAFRDRNAVSNLIRFAIIGIVAAVAAFALYNARLRADVSNGIHPSKVKANSWVIGFAVFAAIVGITTPGLSAPMIAVLFILPLIFALAVSRSVIVTLSILLIGGTVATARLFNFI